MAVPQNPTTLTPYEQRMANFLNGNTFRRACGKRRFTCNSLSRNISEFPALEDYLPKNYDYHICDFDLIRDTGDHSDFKTTFRMALSSKEDIKLWMKSHAVTWRVDRTYVTKGQKVIFKVDYRCQRNTKPRRAVQVSSHSKNTDCPAMMSVKLFRTQVSRGRQSIGCHFCVPCVQKHRFSSANFSHDVPDVKEYEVEVEIGDDYEFATADGTLSSNPEFNYVWLEAPGVEVVVEDVEENPAEEGNESELGLNRETRDVFSPIADHGFPVSHQTAALEFEAMCQKLCEMVKSNESFTGPATAAVKAFKEMERNPLRIAAALRTFGRDLASGPAKSKVRRRAGRTEGPSRGRRRLDEESPAGVGLDHVYSQ
ncbi:uncharacterized protein LOC133493786 isoform X2 [Syngnathoides biaculeatus]|uniref:uncharacterized protein LOC133493786 isoform X2 n=1 Tax=Syngnathoides biaculeatus TaxID=300417 RepID=UPI002ADE8C48|nr:uncharacterized protein LOC133493786 isoform X2 [Syngnathoides biaculeatus]